MLDVPAIHKSCTKNLQLKELDQSFQQSSQHLHDLVVSKIAHAHLQKTGYMSCNRPNLIAGMTVCLQEGRQDATALGF